MIYGERKQNGHEWIVTTWPLICSDQEMNESTPFHANFNKIEWKFIHIIKSTELSRLWIHCNRLSEKILPIEIQTAMLYYCQHKVCNVRSLNTVVQCSRNKKIIRKNVQFDWIGLDWLFESYSWLSQDLSWSNNVKRLFELDERFFSAAGRIFLVNLNFKLRCVHMYICKSQFQFQFE